MAQCPGCGETFDSPHQRAGHMRGCDAEPEYRDKDELTRLYHDEGMSTTAIADHFGIDSSTVSVAMKDLGVETRSRADGIRNHHRSNLTVYMHHGRWIVQFRAHGESVRIPLSRLVALGEYTIDELAGRDVHHKNGEPLDNTRANLEVKTESEHMSDHANEKERDELGRFA